jgi:hypothetical protein
VSKEKYVSFSSKRLLKLTWVAVCISAFNFRNFFSAVNSFPALSSSNFNNTYFLFCNYNIPYSVIIEINKLIIMKNNDLHQLLKEGKISSKTLERVNIAKSYIEKKYSMKKLKEEEKKKGRKY